MDIDCIHAVGTTTHADEGDGSHGKEENVYLGDCEDTFEAILMQRRSVSAMQSMSNKNSTVYYHRSLTGTALTQTLSSVVTGLIVDSLNALSYLARLSASYYPKITQVKLDDELRCLRWDPIDVVSLPC